MKQKSAGTGTRTPDRGRIFTTPTEWAGKLLLILLGDTDLQADRQSTYNSLPLPGILFLDPINSGGRLCTQVVRSGAVLHWGGVLALIIFVAARD